MNTFADHVIRFNGQLHYEGPLPEGFRVINPFFDNPETTAVMKSFYKKFYDDPHNRRFIIGINPSRHGAGVTGVPFTDTKRLESACGIRMESAHTHEISSVFLYDVIEAYGGTEVFYRDFYINSPFPLTIVRQRQDDGWVNANYYEKRELFQSVKAYMIACMKSHFALGLASDIVYVLGKKNAVFLNELNQIEPLFDRMVVLEHPRYIQQYRSRDRLFFIKKYLDAFTKTDSF